MSPACVYSFSPPSLLWSQLRNSQAASLLSLLALMTHAAPPAALPDPLSKSEREILRLLNRGMTNQEIADQLAITVGTTKWHLNRIFAKLQVTDRSAAIVRARDGGLGRGGTS